MPTATMTSKGQITLPAATRERLRLVKGAKLEVTENANGQIVLTPKPAKTGDIRRLRGILKYDGPPVSIEEMNKAILKAASRRFRESVE
jgi:AbrB family looped-hinge helix DNA binding protein